DFGTEPGLFQRRESNDVKHSDRREQEHRVDHVWQCSGERMTYPRGVPECAESTRGETEKRHSDSADMDQFERRVTHSAPVLAGDADRDRLSRASRLYAA